MSTQPSYADRPNTINVEGATVTLTFERTSPECGVLKWNIPAPADGCDAGTQAYNGIVITGSTAPATRSTSPVNGGVYSADPTMDPDLHAGDSIGSALVLGAFYNDRVTTTFQVCGLDPSKPYYFSAYAVNNVLDYYKGGSHSYSVKVSNDSPHAKSSTQAVHGLTFPGKRVQKIATSSTCLELHQTYSFNVTVNDRVYPIYIEGKDGQTFAELVIAINRALDRTIGQPLVSSQAPNTGVLQLVGNQLRRWNGESYDDIGGFISGWNGVVVEGSYWYDTDNSLLFRRESDQWTSQSFIKFGSDPTQVLCDSYLFNGTQAYHFNGSGWCEVQTFVQSNNPFVPSLEQCSEFWYSEVAYQLYRRVDNQWVYTPVLYHDMDPNTLTTGAYWYNTSNKRVLRRSGTSWAYESTAHVGTSPPQTLVGGQLWYNPTTQVLQQRTMMNTDWLTLSVIVYHQDPTIRDCDLWWNSTTDVLYQWDSLSNAWAEVRSFTISEHDPASGVSVDDSAVWYNPTTGTLTSWAGGCGPETVLLWDGGDPRTIGDGVIWHNTTLDLFYIRSSGAWVQLDVIRYVSDPTQPGLGTFRSFNGELFQWNGASWIPVQFVTYSLTPKKGDRWYDLATETLREWNGTWYASRGDVDVSVYAKSPSGCACCKPIDKYSLFVEDGIYFETIATGSEACIEVRDVNLFRAIQTCVNHKWLRPIKGGDGVEGTPAYMQEGVGTDGSLEERKQLIRNIVLALGGDVIGLELTQESLNHSVDKALTELRLRASPYTRGFFPIQTTLANQKRIMLTNKQLGHNKIVRVLGVYRPSGMYPTQPDFGLNGYSQPWLAGMLTGMPQGQMLTYQLLSMYSEELQTLLARHITFTFNEQTRVLNIHNSLARGEYLLIEAMVEMTEQDIFISRKFKNWIEKWAIAESKVKLAGIRGKFQTLPGPGGGTQLNANELMQSAEAEFAQLLQDVDEFVVQDMAEFPGSIFAIG